MITEDRAKEGIEILQDVIASLRAETVKSLLEIYTQYELAQKLKVTRAMIRQLKDDDGSKHIIREHNGELQLLKVMTKQSRNVWP